MTRDSIVLAAINARYSHPSLGARSLLANMGAALRQETEFLEFNINQPVEAMAEQIIACRPAVAGIGVYLWNRLATGTLLHILRRDMPDLKIVLGGPEVSHDTETWPALGADCIIRGEGEHLWPVVCRDLLAGRPVPRLPPPPHPPDLERLTLPDAEYADEDLRHRNLYIEASRGCPLACDFCLSATDSGVRHYPTANVLAALQRLLDRGALQFRFVDRSFNLGGRQAEALLAFFLERMRPGLRLHFEMTPDGLQASALRDLLVRFPPGTLHLEAGIQSFAPAVLERVHRRGDVEKAAEGIHWLVHQAHADVHADLIAGLPGETLDSLAAGFDRLYRLGPSEIQVGILKRLHGTPLAQAAVNLGLRFRETPPYDVLQTPDMSQDDLDTVRRFAVHWDRIVNRGHFPRSIAALLGPAGSPWRVFNEFSRRLAGEHGLYGLGLVELAGKILQELVEPGGIPANEARLLLREDYLDGGRRQNIPGFLKGKD